MSLPKKNQIRQLEGIEQFFMFLQILDEFFYFRFFLLLNVRQPSPNGILWYPVSVLSPIRMEFGLLLPNVPYVLIVISRFTRFLF